MRKLTVGGMIESKGLTLIRVMGVPDRPGIAGKLFRHLATLRVNVEFISSATDLLGTANLILCVNSEAGSRLEDELEGLRACVDAGRVDSLGDVATIGVYGPHFRETPDVAAQLFSCLAEKEIQVLGVSTSISTVACLVRGSELQSARDAICCVFALP
ncbi:MAG: ACT domain-containing protein [Candidatus Eisenbacteria bacterium]|jgi:aspartokinase|nr:ACT domain-containing protein [Candidatus Eisenbacteria bacterium]